MLYIGIDPGAKGGISFVSEKHGEFSMPLPQVGELRDLLISWQEDFGIKHVFIEKAFGMRGQGVTSISTYMYHAGTLEGVLQTLFIPFTLVPPKDWQKEMFKGTKTPTKSLFKTAKDRALQVARRLFPKQKFIATLKCKKPHDGMIDSILIAEFCRRKIL